MKKYKSQGKAAEVTANSKEKLETFVLILSSNSAFDLGILLYLRGEEINIRYTTDFLATHSKRRKLIR